MKANGSMDTSSVLVAKKIEKKRKTNMAERMSLTPNGASQAVNMSPASSSASVLVNHNQESLL